MTWWIGCTDSLPSTRRSLGRIGHKRINHHPPGIASQSTPHLSADPSNDICSRSMEDEGGGGGCHCCLTKLLFFRWSPPPSLFLPGLLLLCWVNLLIMGIQTEGGVRFSLRFAITSKYLILGLWGDGIFRFLLHFSLAPRLLANLLIFKRTRSLLGAFLANNSETNENRIGGQGTSFFSTPV